VATDLYSLLSRTSREAPSRGALSSAREGSAGSFSHGTLFAAAERAARAFARRGVVRGDRVVFYASPSPEFVIAVLGALRAGAMLVPINTAYRRREIAGILEDAAPRLLLVGEGERAIVDELASEPAATSVQIVGLRDALEEKLEQGGGDSRAGGELALPRLGEDDLALMLYTSGTTGKSKGAELTHGNVVAMIESLRTAWAWSASDRLLLSLPLFHLHGLVVGLFTALASGAEVLLEARFDAARLVDRLAAGDATLFFGVPTLYVRLVDELERRREAGAPADLSRVRLFVSGSAPLAPETFVAFQRLTGQAILERYGMSETGMLLSNPLRGRRIAGSVGTPLPGVEARLVDAAGIVVPPGGEGEIEVRGPSVFRGYRNAPEKTAEAFRRDTGSAPSDRGWFRTGDLARVDPKSGHWFLLGRASELILSGGFNVYPREIEEVILAFPGVREAAVVGEKHAEFGESPAAFLVCDDAVDDAALEAHCRRELAAFKLPRRYLRVDSLPRNAMGKVEKRRLKELLAGS
jgi:malonyl-CoA/methylmalonyl-CoA synthetase